jgi:hypothetical protein
MDALDSRTLTAPTGRNDAEVAVRAHLQPRVRERRDPAAAFLGYALWVLLWTLVVMWAAFLWHPWIDWFGRAR